LIVSNTFCCFKDFLLFQGHSWMNSIKLTRRYILLRNVHHALKSFFPTFPHV
jgi:hypothetical protein